MNLKHTEVIQRFCRLQGEVCHKVLGFEHAADCFCGESGFWKTDGYNPETDYRNDGKALEFIEQAVREKIEREKGGIA